MISNNRASNERSGQVHSHRPSFDSQKWSMGSRVMLFWQRPKLWTLSNNHFLNHQEMQASNYEGPLINSCSLSMSEMPLLLKCKWSHCKLSRLNRLASKVSLKSLSNIIAKTRKSIAPQRSHWVAWKPLEGAPVTRDRSPFLAGHALSNFFWSSGLDLSDCC